MPSEENFFDRPEVIVGLGSVLIGSLIFWLVKLFFTKNEEVPKNDKVEIETDEAELLKKKTKRVTNERKVNKIDRNLPFTHSWLATTLKGHSGRVLDVDFSPNCKYLASCAEDRTVFLWRTREFNQKEHQFVRINVELDHATFIRFSPDNKAFLISLANENLLRVYRLSKKEDGSMANATPTFDFPPIKDSTIITLDIASNGKFIMVNTENTKITLYDIRGEVLDTIDTHQIHNTYATVSPCGRFVASCGFTSDVKVWEVLFDKTGSFQQVKRSFDLKGHNASIYHFAFNAFSSRMATVSKDSTWKLWDTDVQFNLGQDPKILMSGSFSNLGLSLVSLSPDTRSMVISSASTLCFVNLISGKTEETIEEISGKDLKVLRHDSSGRRVVTAGEKHIQVFHDFTWYRATILENKSKLIGGKKSVSAALRQRLETEVDECQQFLDDNLLVQ